MSSDSHYEDLLVIEGSDAPLIVHIAKRIGIQVITIAITEEGLNQHTPKDL